jgi:hypothetical protein
MTKAFANTLPERLGPCGPLTVIEMDASSEIAHDEPDEDAGGEPEPAELPFTIHTDSPPWYSSAQTQPNRSTLPDFRTSHD